MIRKLMTVMVGMVAVVISGRFVEGIFGNHSEGGQSNGALSSQHELQDLAATQDPARMIAFDPNGDMSYNPDRP
jgi:hypothetical protein